MTTSSQGSCHPRSRGDDGTVGEQDLLMLGVLDEVAAGLALAGEGGDGVARTDEAVSLAAVLA